MGKVLIRIVLGILLTFLVLAGMLLGYSLLNAQELETDFYHLSSDKITAGETVRLIVLADLHNAEFGENNCDLVEQVRELSPDLIVIAGDMVDKSSDNTEIAVSLAAALNEIAPVYYGLGNHEGTMVYENGIRVDQELRDAGVTVLINEAVSAEIRGTVFSIGSICTSEEDYALYSPTFMEEFEQMEGFRLLIAHFPSIFYDILADADIDLGVSGHYHGGQIVIPFLGGLYSKEHGLFPKYSGGMYSIGKGTLFVSRGLGNHDWVPRINNNPQIAVIDINAR